MVKQWVFRLAVSGLFLFMGGVILYRPLIRPWHARWGASEREVQAVQAGDDIVPNPADQTTRAVTIQAQPEQIWPWLLQMGQGRGGMYSYDWLENLAGCDIHTLDQIVTELQTLKVGDIIRLGPQEGLPYYQVVLLETQKALVLQSVDPGTGSLGETWGFYLHPQDTLTTRLIIRHRTPPSSGTAAQIVTGIFDPIVFIMEHRMLNGLRDHAENMNLSASTSK